MPDKEKDFFARRIQTWYRRQRDTWYDSHQYPKSFYVLKEKCGSEHLKKEAIVKEHIASVLYRLLGIRTPETRIVTDDDNQIVGLISRYIPGYKDLEKIINEGGETSSEALINALDDEPTQSSRIAIFQNVLNKIPIAAKETLLIAAVCLMDPDIIGAGLSNIGGVWDPDKKQYEWVKIDPGSLDYHTGIEDFEKDVSLDNPILSTDFTSRVYNDPNFLSVGNLHLLEFFSDTDKEQLVEAAKMLLSVSDDEIKRHVIRQAYLDIVGPSMLNQITDSIIKRKKHLLSLLDLSDKPIMLKTVSLQPIFVKREVFSDPVHTIPRGNAQPSIVYCKEDEELSLNKRPIITSTL